MRTAPERRPQDVKAVALVDAIPAISGGLEDQEGGGRPWILMAGAAFPEIAGAAFARHQGNRTFHALPGGIR